MPAQRGAISRRAFAGALGSLVAGLPGIGSAEPSSRGSSLFPMSGLSERCHFSIRRSCDESKNIRKRRC
jgi:hypothetical protein